ncbi:MAG: hypothetical protein KGJ49_10915 [Alphaproteobacteria bacterium]|nr:hypothetical protein [Alphaproteobacteria bacterium]
MIRKRIVGACMAVALVSGSAMANQFSNSTVMNHPYPYPGPLSNVAQCPVGFTAMPATIDPKNPYGQSYTCTGPAAVCSPGFKLVPSVAGTIPGGPGQFGTTIYGSPVTLKNGRMVYTCSEPQPPPQ